jgi:hypothetical protein
MIDEHVCLKTLSRILFEYSDDRNIKKVSINELEPMYQEIAEDVFRISVSNVHKFKNMLWNFDNLKSEIRLKLQKDLCDKWRTAYINSINIELAEDRPVTEKQDLIAISENQSSKETATQSPVPPTERSDKKQEKETLETVSDTRRSILTGQVYKRDWFDKFVDIVAFVMGYFGSLIPH